MSTLNISMPEAMRQYIEAQAEAGNFTASEYVRHLIRLDQERQEKRAKIAQYLELCEQGPFTPWNMEEMIAEGEREYRRRKKNRKEQ